MAVETHSQNPGEAALLGELKLWWEAESRLDSLGARYSGGDDVWLSDVGEFRNRITRAQRIFGADLDSDVRGALVRAGCVTRDELAWADSLVKRPDPDDRDGQDAAGGSDEEAAAAIPEEPHAAEPHAAEPAAEEPVATPSAAETEAPDDAAPAEPAVDDESGADHDDGEADDSTCVYTGNESGSTPVESAPVELASITSNLHGLEHGFIADAGLRTLGTRLVFADSMEQARRQAEAQNKLLFVMHVSGNFEIEGFT